MLSKEALIMDIHTGLLVKTLSDRVVKVEKEEAQGYWHCE
jgi:hypothetical protein